MVWEKLYRDVRNDLTKERKAKTHAHSLPWINTQIKKKINERYKQLNKAKNSGVSDWLEYKKIRNKATSLLRAEETFYWQKELKAAYSDKKSFGIY